MPVAENSKFSEEITTAIVASLEGGNYLVTAAEAAGVSEATVREWVRRGEGRDDRAAEPEFVAFAAEVRRARAVAEKRAVKALTAAAPDDWRAAEAWLKRARPDRWSETQRVDHTSGGQSLAELFAATPLGQSHSELPVDEPEGWEGTDG